MAEPLTYVFCLLRAVRRPSVKDVPIQLPDARDLRCLEAGPGSWLVVASVPARAYNEAALAAGFKDLNWVGRRAMAHEAVVEHFLAARALLPMQLFTLFTSDHRAQEWAHRQQKKIGRVLARIEGHHEWGLRLTFDEQGARQPVVAGRRRRVTSGSEYLARKRDLIDANRAQITASKAAAIRVYRALSHEAARAKRRTGMERTAPGSRLLLDAAFLVPIKRATAFRNAMRRQVKALGAAGVVVALTGPWPPYNFI